MSSLLATPSCGLLLISTQYLIAPLDAIKARAASDGTTITTSTTDDTASGATAAQAASTAIVFINSDSGENYLTVEGAAGDRLNLDPWHNGNGLVATVAATGKPTIVVIHSVGPLILEPIVSLSNVVAVVWAGIPGQESGNGLVDVLYGTVSPNGKLPYTIAKAAGDYGTGIASGDDNYGEGLFVDYRHFDMAGITPRYEFGFGLCKSAFLSFFVLCSPKLNHTPALAYHSASIHNLRLHLSPHYAPIFLYYCGPHARDAPRPRRPILSLHAPLHCFLNNHQHGLSRRLRDRAAIHHSSVLRSILAPAPTPRLQQAQPRARRPRHRVVPAPKKGSVLLGCRCAEMGPPCWHVCAQRRRQ